MNHNKMPSSGHQSGDRIPDLSEDRIEEILDQDDQSSMDDLSEMDNWTAPVDSMDSGDHSSGLARWSARNRNARPDRELDREKRQDSQESLEIDDEMGDLDSEFWQEGQEDSLLTDSEETETDPDDISYRRVYQRHEKKPMSRTRKVLIGLGIAVPVLLLSVVVLVVSVVQSGRNRLKDSAIQEGSGIEQVLPTQEPIDMEQWEEDWIRYNGKVYEYNENLLTFLFLGIDKHGEVDVGVDGIDGGQSDAMFLVLLDTQKKQLSVVAINRNTMADVDVYSRQGNYLRTQKAQICLQHGYGDGKELSCERSVKAVSRLFYGIPIHGYCSINMESIPILNDAVGGVKVKVLETMKNQEWGVDFDEGDEITLKGQDSYWYVKYRDVSKKYSADGRLNRQKQYMLAWAKKAKKVLKSDVGLIMDLYQSMKNYIVTNVSVDEIVYLASEALSFDFSKDSLYSVKGESIKNDESGFEEFHPDEEAMYDMIINAFYTEVKQFEPQSTTTESTSQVTTTTD